MGYVYCYGSCGCCGKDFGFNPKRVPSFRKDPGGPRQPLCYDCIQRVNPLRVRNGLNPIVIPKGAYEPVDESEL